MVAFTGKVIGILGGMGPEATAELYLRNIRLLQAEGARYDADFPEMLIYNLPLPDMVEQQGNKKAIAALLRQAIARLRDAGADFIAIPCNTAFSYMESGEGILSIVAETRKEIARWDGKVGVLGTEATIRSRLYEGIIPDSGDQRKVTRIIMNILSGKKLRSDKDALLGIMGRLQEKGATGVVLGCTELPLLVSQKDAPIMMFDTLDVLARAVIGRWRR